MCKLTPSPSNWRWPEVPGIQAFQGNLIHTARWPKDFKYANKAVAVIGNGSSGIQLMPEIQPDVKRLYQIVRTPTWILPPRIQAWKIMGQASDILSQVEMDDRENFSQEQIDRFKSDPEFYRKFVKAIEKEVNSAFPIVSYVQSCPLARLVLIRINNRCSRTVQCKRLPVIKSLSS